MPCMSLSVGLGAERSGPAVAVTSSCSAATTRSWTPDTQSDPDGISASDPWYGDSEGLSNTFLNSYQGAAPVVARLLVARAPHTFDQ